VEDAGPRLAFPGGNLYGDRRGYRDLPPFRISMASPNE